MDNVGEGVPEGCTELPYGLLPMMRFDTKDHPTHPAHNTAAITRRAQRASGLRQRLGN